MTLAGFIETKLIDPFEILLGPVFEQGAPGAKTFALPIDERHVNARGVIHGGMLLTFADCALGQAVWDVTDKARSVTLNMQGQYLKPAKVGDIVIVTPGLVKRTKAFVFMRGDFRVRNDTIFAATSVWKLLGQ